MKRIIFLFALCVSIFACQNSSDAKVFGSKTNKIVLIKTEFGDIKIKLFDETPLHRDNFVKLCKKNYFNGTLFHRVIKDFMIQGGDPDSKGAEKGARLGEGGPNYTIDAEINSKYFHQKGALSAAREGDKRNPDKKSSGSQFYIAQGKIYRIGELDSLVQNINRKRKMKIFNRLRRQQQDSIIALQKAGEIEAFTAMVTKLQNQVDSILNIQKLSLSKEQITAYTTVGGVPHLDGNYTVFGQVIEGLDIIDKIAAQECDYNNRPRKDIEMEIIILKK